MPIRQDCGELTIIPTLDQDDVSITSCNVSSNEIAPGGSVEVTFRVTNQNDVGFSGTAEVLANEEPIASRSIQVGASTDRNFSMVVGQDLAGGDYTFRIEVGGITSMAGATAARHRLRSRARVGSGGGCATCGGAGRNPLRASSRRRHSRPDTPGGAPWWTRALAL